MQDLGLLSFGLPVGSYRIKDAFVGSAPLCSDVEYCVRDNEALSTSTLLKDSGVVAREVWYPYERDQPSVPARYKPESVQWSTATKAFSQSG